MRHCIILLMFTILAEPSFGQLEPTLNDEEVLKKFQIKSLTTFCYDHEDTTRSTKRLLFKKDYDNSGKLISKYLLTLWDMVSYDRTTTYAYDNNNNLTEETIIQKILNLDRKDEEYIRALGDDPSNEKFIYYYDGDNRLIKTERYMFGKDGFDKSQGPARVVTFEYVNGLLAKEVTTVITTYEYNDLRQKIRATTIFTMLTNPSKRTETWVYNDQGLVVEDVVVDEVNPWSDSHTKYEYNHKGKMTQVRQFPTEFDERKGVRIYTYDKSGNLLLGDDETAFEYYNNGLVKREFRKSKSGDETKNYITTYTFW